MDVPLAQVLNPYRAMLAVLYPESGQLTGVLRASSVVYIACRLTFAAPLVAFGTWKLRVWNPGKNEPRELREGAEGEGIESLVEVEEETAAHSVRRAAGRLAAVPLQSLVPMGLTPVAQWRLHRETLSQILIEPAEDRNLRPRRGSTCPGEHTAGLQRLPSPIANRGPIRSSGVN